MAEKKRLTIRRIKLLAADGTDIDELSARKAYAEGLIEEPTVTCLVNALLRNFQQEQGLLEKLPTL